VFRDVEEGVGRSEGGAGMPFGLFQSFSLTNLAFLKRYEKILSQFVFFIFWGDLATL